MLHLIAEEREVGYRLVQVGTDVLPIVHGIVFQRHVGS